MYAGMVTAFCEKLGWNNLELLIGQFQDRLEFGVQRELIDLCRLTCLNGQRARVLFNAGVDSVAVLANSKIEDIENLLQNCAPFETAKVAVEGESEKDILARKQLRSFWVTGLKGVTEAEAAKLIVEEARDLLQKDLGVEVTTWGEQSNPIIGDSVLSSSIRRRSSSYNPSAHMSFLKGNASTSGGGRNGTTSKKTKTKKKTRAAANKSKVKPKAKPKPNNKTNSYQIKARRVDKNSSFDFSAQMEEIFESTMNEQDHVKHETPPEKPKSPVKDESVMPSGAKKKKRVSWGENEVQSPRKAPKLDFEKQESVDEVQKNETNPIDPPNKNDETEDAFGDSFVDMDALEEIEKENRHVTVNKSCPKTPNYLVNSEKLELKPSDTATHLMKEETITDSFLEAALATHMSEPGTSKASNEKSTVSIAKTISDLNIAVSEI